MNRNTKLIILLIVAMSIVLAGCKGKTDNTQVTDINSDEKVIDNAESKEANTNKSDKDKNGSSENLDEEGKIKEKDNLSLEESDGNGVNDKYSKYLLFINENDDNTLYSLNKETKECKQIFERSIDNSYSNELMKLDKKNYFMSNNKMYLLDGDSFKTSLVKYIEYPVKFAGDKILYCKDSNVYIQNIDDDKEILLLENKYNLNVLHEDNITYIQVDDSKEDYLRHIYKYNMETAKLDEIIKFSLHDCNYNDGIRITKNKNLYFQADSKIKKYDYETDTIVDLQKETYNKKVTEDSLYVYSPSYSFNSIYVINGNKYMKEADFQNFIPPKGVVLDDDIYLLTTKGHILSLDKKTTDIIDILYWNKESANDRYDQEKIFKLKDDKMYYEDYLMDFYTAEEKDMYKANIVDYYYMGNKEHKSECNNSYMIKAKNTYLESDINEVKDDIKEEYKEFAFSSEILAYTRKKDNHLVIIDRKFGDTLLTTDFPVINIKAYSKQVYYTRYDEQFGFYCYSKDEHKLIDKKMVLDYAVTNKNIYYSTNYPIRFYCKDKSTNKITSTNDSVQLMMSESDTLYFVENQLLYKIKDNKNKKELISVIPKGGAVSHLFMHNNQIYSGDSGSMCTRIFKFDKEYKKPDEILYEDDKALIYAVENSLYTYDKINRTIKSTVDFFYPSDSTLAITDDAVYISNDDSIVFKITLNTLEVKEFYKSIFGMGGEGDPLDMYIVNEKYCVIGNNNGVASHEGMTIIDIDTMNRKDIKTGNLIYALNNKVYYMDEDNSLKVIDLTNGFNINPKTILDSVSGYTTIYNNNIIFEKRNELIMVDNRNDNTKLICSDFSYFIGTKKDNIYYNNINGELVRLNLSSLKKDVIGDNFYDIVGISDIYGQTVVLYMDNDSNLIRVDDDKTILTSNMYVSYKTTNDTLVFTKEGQDGNQIKDIVYFYEIDTDKMYEIKLDKNKTDNGELNYFIDDEKITIKIDNKEEWSSKIDNINWSIKKEIYLD
ncbi:hypothetical protein [Vallitalea maricola]|uniref:Uncharacterized protein n=1 Tax=Vallitalea maricola TaxID=3074433 RepID=A0ACB5UL22_9FIRM|nr:hypothetical protein AN2V17_28980 [Vallitalea sp. AN17-2]